MLESLLTHYGYPIIIIGTFFEGETIMVLGAVAAHLGYLSLEGVIACGFIGSLCGDQLYFLVGRRYGQRILARRPAWQSRTQRVLSLLERHHNLLILGFRFLYGLRSITPFAIGLGGISYLRFALLNMVGAALWAISIGVAGYIFGHAMQSLLLDIKRHELELMAGIVAVGALAGLIHLYRGRRKRPPRV